MSTFSPDLRIELIATGDQSGAWGNTTNTNLGTLIEGAIAGNASVSVTTAKQALTANNGAADQARMAALTLTTTTGAAFEVYAPPAPKQYAVYNAASYDVTLYNSTVLGNTTPAGLGVVVPAGKQMAVRSDGTNFYSQNTYLGAPTIASPTLTGTPVAPTAAPGTNTTQIATTAFVAATTTTALPAGVIVMWSGSIASVPTGWYLCNGSNGTPDLRDRFVVGAGSTYAVAATGGSADAVVVSHTHTATSTFTGSALANHTHTLTDPGHFHSESGAVGGVGIGQGTSAALGTTNTGTKTTGITLASASAGTPAGSVATTNASTGVSGTNANLPPYYALAYIMKA